ncbi:MAG: hypothetical protein J3K34DRAFT_83827 [Monoraphidium minutum]|nr:MAG: hypothetical protein J3K34DRAFT_83827 [Monoraphidium minutum]
MATWASAPSELIQELGLCLGTREWAAARLACRHWRAHVTAGITLLELDLERSPHRWAMVGGAVRRLFPRLRSAALLVGTRVGAAEFADRMAELALMMDLPELELRYVPVASPRLGSVLADVSGVAELMCLRVLKLSGGPTPSVDCIQALSRLRRLSELEVLPGDYGALHSDMLPPNDAAESPVNYGLTDHHCAPLERLTALTSLLIKVKPEAFSSAGLASLASLPDLRSLVRA